MAVFVRQFTYLGGLPKDLHEAARLYKLTADQGIDYARTALTRLGRLRS
jgi:hypothetical protein